MENIQSFNAIKPRVGVAAWVIDEGKVLMGKRRNSHGEGMWACPGGHLEYGEEPAETAARELKEETDLQAIDIVPEYWTNDLFEIEKKHFITIHMIITKYEGELKLNEPDKCSEWKWFSLKEFPEELFLPVRLFLETGILQKYLIKSNKELVL